MRGDVSNFVDGIIDAIKKPIGIDDNYASTVADWTIDKINPRIEITVIYEEGKC